jgi:formylglycine-generating enzyme required for sulfatase activity
MKQIFQKRFSIVETIGLLVLVLLDITAIGYAVSVPNTFTSGTTVSSSDVNANFTALADAINKKESDCNGNSLTDIMVKVGPLCVDKYEASAWSNADGTGTQYGDPGASFNLTDYPGGFPVNGNWTTPVYAVSKAGVLPSTNLSWFQAQQACALSGKRLLTNAEWLMAASGTPDPGTDNHSTDCAVGSVNPVNTGSRSGCVSNWGVNDMVGNVNEWVADWMHGGSITWAASAGSAGTDYGTDMISGINPAVNQGTNSSHFPAGVVRGGSWINGSDAGVFAMELDFSPTLKNALIRTGFRCAR